MSALPLLVLPGSAPYTQADDAQQELLIHAKT